MVTISNYSGLQTLPKPLKENESGKRKRPELLSPAGDFDSLKAAIENGADAVYLGLKEFNARRQARNFNLEELEEAIRYAHLRNKKVYLTTNILIKEREIEKALEHIEKALTFGIDALIVQDIGLAYTLSQLYDGVKLHASTQLNCHNVSTALFLKELGFKRIVLSRELTLSEVKKIKSESGVEVEIFAHGALCYSYSGQCLMSSFVGRRSGNRGLCAQPCRLSYQIVINKDGKDLHLDTLGDYPISTKDLCTLSLIPEILEAGIDALKIEGRLKSPEYVAVVTKVYRREIDRAVANPANYYLLRESIEQLEEVFSRGFSAAYLGGIRDNRMMSYTRPNNRGAFVGRVVYVDSYSGKVGIKLRKTISKGDILEFWVSKEGRVVQEVKSLSIEGREVDEALEGKRAEVVVEKDRHLIKAGDRVYRVYNAKLNYEAEASFKKQGQFKIPVKIFVKILKNEPVYASAMTEDAEVEITTEIFPEESKGKDLSFETVKTQMKKLGDTAYELVFFEAMIGERLFLPLRKINQIRRDLIEKLDRARLLSKKPDYSKKASFESIIAEGEEKRKVYTPALTVKAADYETAKAALEAGADIVYLKPPPYRGQEKLTEEKLLRLREIATLRDKWLGLSTPNVIKDSEIDYYLNFLKKHSEIFDVVLVDNHGFLLEAQKVHRNIVGDYHLNIFNSRAFAAYRKASVRRLTLSLELSADEIDHVLRRVDIPVEVIVHGDVEVMTAEHCLLLVISDGNDRYAKTGMTACAMKGGGEERPAYCEMGMAYIEDEKEYRFPIMTDIFCRGHIFNSKVLCAASVISKLRAAGINYFRLELLLPRSQKEVSFLVKSYRSLIDDASSKNNYHLRSLSKKICSNGFTTGHYHRGVF